MLAWTEILTPHWAVFILGVLVFLALDLGVFHREARVVRMREAGLWTALCFAAAMLFAYFLAPEFVHGWERQHTEEFVTGYILELSLSMDNVFVIALIFTYFKVPSALQHRVLFWGVLGALVMRGVMIFVGVELVERFAWLLYVLGVFLILTAAKMIFGGDDEVHPERNLAIRLARKFFPVSTEYDGQSFVTFQTVDKAPPDPGLGRQNPEGPRKDESGGGGAMSSGAAPARGGKSGRWALTPLALVLLMVETTDLIFAVDSIPAILGVTTNFYVVFTSNVFAILGLRSLYFVLAGMIDYFRYLKLGLAVVLAFIGVKMLIAETRFHISTRVSLWIVAGIILTAILASVVTAKLGSSKGGDDSKSSSASAGKEK
jgi:tellurite resistance protein TerC